jgi:hypothetical protein
LSTLWFNIFCGSGRAVGHACAGPVSWRHPAVLVGTLHQSRSNSIAGQLSGLFRPGGKLSFVELVVLVDVDVAEIGKVVIVSSTFVSSTGREI